MSQTFKFFIPATIEKSVTDSKGNPIMKVKGISSTSDEDTDGETLEPVGFDLDPLLKTGFINYNHQAKNSPKAIIGQPTVAKILKGNKLYIEGFLYPNSDLARDVYNQISVIETDGVDRQMGWSIEGIPIERDPLNPKRIVKAQITGVAITASPKNSKTFIEIVKSMDAGTLEDLSDEQEEDTEKSMTVADLPVVESVEGGKKLKESLDEIKKSEIYSIIDSRLGSVDANCYEKILNFTINYAKAKNMGYNFETIEKALDLLESEIVLNKSADYPPIDDDSDDADNEEEDDDDDDEEEEDEDNGIEKSINDSIILEVAKNYAFPGVTEVEVTEYLVRQGFSLTPSSQAAASVIADMEKNPNGGDVEELDDKISKAVENKLASFKDEQGKFFDKFLGILNKFNDKIESIQKSNIDQINVYKSEIEKSNVEIGKLSSSIDTIVRNEPVSRKSLTSANLFAKPIERFEKGDSSDKMDSNSFSISNPLDRSRLADRLDAEYQIQLQKSPSVAAVLEKAITEFEIGKVIRDEFVPTIQALGINLFK